MLISNLLSHGDLGILFFMYNIRKISYLLILSVKEVDKLFKCYGVVLIISSISALH